MGGACGMWHVWEAREIHVGFWWGDLKEIAHIKDIGVDGRILLKWIFK
jgi:hypothetical protein